MAAKRPTGNRDRHHDKTQDDRNREHEERVAHDNAMWLSILRKVSNVDKRWKRCNSVCRRARGCMASSRPLPCNALRLPSKPVSDEQRSRAMFQLKTALAARLARIEAESRRQ